MTEVDPVSYEQTKSQLEKEFKLLVFDSWKEFAIQERMKLMRLRIFRAAEKPKVVCLCGSTRFWKEFQRAGLKETMEGKIVLSIGAASGTDDEHFGNLPREEYNRVKEMLDELHKRKIDLADEVLILNVGGYIGQSTQSELEYAKAHGKSIRFLEPVEELSKEGEKK